MRKIIVCLLLFTCFQTFGQSKYQQDFVEFWTDFKNNYAYFDTQAIDWSKVKKIYLPKVAKVKNKWEFIRLLEIVINELHNGHISLNTNLPSSNRIIPSGQDLYIQRLNNKVPAFIIKDVRPGSKAVLAGLKAGMQVVKFNNKPIEKSLRTFLPQSAKKNSPAMYAYAVNMLFAGTHNQPRQITVLANSKEINYFPDKLKALKPSDNLLSFEKLPGNIGYIKVHNSLGNLGVIHQFDQALDALMDTKSLILDLTDTPGGGNTTIARAIMGRFITKEMPYQKHAYPLNSDSYGIKRSWLELVTPRKIAYTKPLIVTVSHWTGSMGEGLAIGFDGMKRATIVGTKMAGLLGEIHSYKLKETNIGFQIPDIKLLHIDGTPREKYLPKVLTQHLQETLQKAKILAEKAK